MKDYFGLKDKVCVITGSSNGMGKATAEMLVELGAKVYSVSRRPSGVPGVVENIVCDVFKKEQIDAAFAQRKIHVNAVLPRGTDTGLRDDFASMAGDLESMIENGTGLAHRLSLPNEMASAMAFLASDMACFPVPDIVLEIHGPSI